MKFEMPEFTFTIPDEPVAPPEAIKIEIPPMKIPPKPDLKSVIARIKKKTKSVRGIVDRQNKLS